MSQVISDNMIDLVTAIAAQKDPETIWKQWVQTLPKKGNSSDLVYRPSVLTIDIVIDVQKD
jgi:hypothetical protein